MWQHGPGQWNSLILHAALLVAHNCVSVPVSGVRYTQHCAPTNTGVARWLYFCLYWSTFVARKRHSPHFFSGSGSLSLCLSGARQYATCTVCTHAPKEQQARPGRQKHTPLARFWSPIDSKTNSENIFIISCWPSFEYSAAMARQRPLYQI